MKTWHLVLAGVLAVPLMGAKCGSSSPSTAEVSEEEEPTPAEDDASMEESVSEEGMSDESQGDGSADDDQE